uniref:Uncharacterized protein n=1 Tax=Salarias fasciatus TaxID=181472 RepID=A0A672H7G8_SALFA
CVCQLVSSSPYLIKATHTSPATRTVSDLQFLLEQSTVCKVTVKLGFCFCSGSKLVDAEGYKQFSNKWICPGFDTINCTVSKEGRAHN